MRQLRSHLTWLALVLCTGCAAPYPRVPHSELAERILDPAPSRIDLPSQNARPDEMSQPKDSIGQQQRTSPILKAIAEDFDAPDPQYASPTQIRTPGRRLKISQASALSEPIDHPPPIVDQSLPPEPNSDASNDQLTLASAIDLAYRSSPQIQAARAKIELARAGKEIAYSDFLPQFDMGFRHVVGQAPGGYVLPTIPTSIGNVAYGGSAQEFDVAELRAQWTLWDFGRTASKYGQSLIMQDIAGLQYVRTQQTVSFDVASAYFESLSAKAAYVAAQEAVRRAQSALNDAKNYLKRGNAIRNDMLRADVFLKEMQLEVVKAETAKGVAIAKLNHAIGINSSCPTEVVELIDAPPFDQPLTQCLQLAVENRREFGVVERGIAKAKLGQNLAVSDFLPKIVVGGLGSLQQNQEPTRFSQLGSAGIGIELGLYQGGRRVGEIHGAQAEIDLAVASGKQVCDQIAYEVKVGYLAITDAAERIKVARTAVAQASENLRVVQSLFSQGDTIVTDVIDAELTLTRAQQDFRIATYDYQTALARLAFAVGLPPESFLALPATR